MDTMRGIMIICVSISLLAAGKAELTWTKTAAEEAEAVAAISCSGHGRAFVDGIKDNKGRPVCECNNCYTGPDCSRFLHNCSADATSGDPVFLEPYWRRHAESSAVVISPWHRMSYDADGRPYMTRELERHVRLLHRLVGNAAAEGKNIVFGAGSTQLLNAALHALAGDNSSPSTVVATVPYYPAYRTQTQYWKSKVFEWKGATSEWRNSSSTASKNFIEFVTSPNNPDGRWQAASLSGSSVINDRAYYWPHYAAIKSPADDDLMLFTLSKVTGHAGSRFGWALIKNETVYQKILEYMDTDTMGISRETQLRALKLIQETIVHIRRGRDIFRFGHAVVKDRWIKLKAVVSSSDRFSLQNLSPEYCNYFRTIRDPSPAYAWVKCEREIDADCYEVLKKGMIDSRAGTMYGADKYYVRLSLIRSEDDFDQMLMRMKALSSQ